MNGIFIVFCNLISPMNTFEYFCFKLGLWFLTLFMVWERARNCAKPGLCCRRSILHFAMSKIIWEEGQIWNIVIKFRLVMNSNLDLFFANMKYCNKGHFCTDYLKFLLYLNTVYHTTFVSSSFLIWPPYLTNWNSNFPQFNI